MLNNAYSCYFYYLNSFSDQPVRFLNNGSIKISEKQERINEFNECIQKPSMNGSILDTVLQPNQSKAVFYNVLKIEKYWLVEKKYARKVYFILGCTHSESKYSCIVYIFYTNDIRLFKKN